MINQLIHNILIASICSTIFSCIFILFRNVIYKYIGARWNYYLWFIIFIPWVSIWFPLNFSPKIHITSNLQVITNYLNNQLQHTPDRTGFSPLNIIFIFWITGTLIFAIYLLIRHFHYVSLLKMNSQPITDLQKNTVKNAVMNKDLIPLSRIYISNFFTSPMICHIFKSKIYLPEQFFKDYTSTEQRYILQHECIHYQRCDLIANTAMLALICLNWFNPIIYLSYGYFLAAQELSCDAIVSYQFSHSEKKAYGYALLKSVFKQSSQIPAMNCWWNAGKQLKERCSMLKFHHSKPLKNFLGMIIFAIATSIAIAAPNLVNRDASADMKISNSSTNNLSFSIDNKCSEEIGVIKATSIKMISRENINKACQRNPVQCKTYVYPTNNCTGSPIAMIIFDINLGVQTIAVYGGDYNIAGTEFNLLFAAPWTNVGSHN